MTSPPVATPWVRRLFAPWRLAVRADRRVAANPFRPRETRAGTFGPCGQRIFMMIAFGERGRSSAFDDDDAITNSFGAGIFNPVPLDFIPTRSNSLRLSGGQRVRLGMMNCSAAGPLQPRVKRRASMVPAMACIERPMLNARSCHFDVCSGVALGKRSGTREMWTATRHQVPQLPNRCSAQRSGVVPTRAPEESRGLRKREQGPRLRSRWPEER
jgi:hypothetical protein